MKHTTARAGEKGTAMLRLVSSLLLVVGLFGCSKSEPATVPGSDLANATPVPTIHKGKADASTITNAAQSGAATIVCNLTEEEIAKNAAAGFDERALAAQSGLTFVHIPVAPAGYTVENVDAFAKVMDETGGRFVAHCASGNRSAGLYALWLARYRKVPVDEAIERAKALGLGKDATIASVREIAAKP